MRLPSSHLRARRSSFWIAALLLVGCKSTPGAKAPVDAEIGTGGAVAGVGGAVSGTGGAGGIGSGAGGASGGVGGGSGGAGLGGAAGSHGTGGAGIGGSPAKDAGSGFVDAGPDPGTDGDGDFTIGPTYTISPDLMTQNVPHGRSFTFTMSSTASAIYTGLDPTLLAANQHSFTRQVRVYVPMQYVDGTAAKEQEVAVIARVGEHKIRGRPAFGGGDVREARIELDRDSRWGPVVVEEQHLRALDPELVARERFRGMLREG